MARRYRYKEIQLPQLRSFCLAAVEGNFTAAARALGLSAPTVWEQVRALERRLGASLLLRHGRAVELTAEGRLLLELIQPHVAGIDSLDRLFQTQRASLPQRLTLASTPYVTAHHLVDPVRRFIASRPEITVNVRSSIRLEDALEQLERSQVDLAVVPDVGDAPRPASLEYEHLFDMHFMLLTANDHPLARKRKVGLDDVVKYPLITQLEGTLSRRRLEQLLRRHNLTEQAHLVMISSHFDVIRNYVTAGIGIAMVYASPAAATPGLRLRVFDPGLEGLPVALVQRKGAHLSSAAQEFRQLVRDSLRPV